jgi:hypothetical protein
MIRRVERQLGGRLLSPKCSAQGCEDLGFEIGGKLFCAGHWRRICRLVFAQRIDALGLLHEWTRLYGPKLPADPVKSIPVTLHQIMSTTFRARSL